MMPRFDLDTASALSKGARCYQEDAVIVDCAHGADVGMVVLSDGMGGHAAGDVASKIVASEVYNELFFQKGSVDAFEAAMTAALRSAAMTANACLKDHIGLHPETRGMGATLVASVLLKGKLHWISIGDSPLFLFRDGALVQLNEDHSMAPQIDFMVSSGLLSVEAGQNHPDRNTLTSVLIGSDVPKIDCPEVPVALEDRDVIVVASDGLQFLSNSEIEAVLARTSGAQSAHIAQELLKQVTELDDPDLDNVSFAIVQVRDTMHEATALQRHNATSEIRRVG